MIALLCFVLAVLVLPFKSKSRLEAEKCCAPTPSGCIAPDGARARAAYEQRSLVLYPAVSMVSIGPEGHHGHPSRDARPVASGRLSSLLALEVAPVWRAAAD